MAASALPETVLPRGARSSPAPSSRPNRPGPSGRTVYRAATHPWLCATATTLAYAAGLSIGLAVDSRRRMAEAHEWAFGVSFTVAFALSASLLGAWAGRALARAPAD